MVSVLFNRKKVQMRDSLAKALVKMGKAEYCTRDMRAGSNSEQCATGTSQTRDVRTGSSQKEDIKQLRADYQEVYGKRPFPGWDEATLRRKIDEALDA